MTTCLGMGKSRKSKKNEVKALVYICPSCGKRFEAHIRDTVYERKLLYCSDCSVVMNCTISAVTIRVG